MQIGFDPIAAVLALAALGFALWERHQRRARERLVVRAWIDLDDTDEISVCIDLTNRETTAVFPDTFTFASGDKQRAWALGLLPEATRGIASGKHWRHYIPFPGDPTQPYRWTLRLQDGRAFSGTDHQVSPHLRSLPRGRWDRFKARLRGREHPA